MGADPPTRSRRLLLTFRLDRDLRQRLRTRLAGEGRTLSEVVILGLQLYVQHSTWFTGSATSAPPDPPATPELTAPPEPPRATTAVASAADLVLPDHVATYLRDLRESGPSELLSAALGRLHHEGWPLR